MRRQAGFVVWAVLGLVIAAGAATGWAWIERERRQAATAERDAARALAKLRQAEVEDWRSKVDEVRNRCNAATAKAAADAAARDQEAEKAIEAARAGERTWKSQAETLRAAKAARPATGLTEAEKACPAGAAVAKVREAIR